MKAVDERDDEESSDENNPPTDEANDESSSVPTKHDPNINALSASEMLTKACYRNVTKNYYGIPNCGYNHDAGIIAAARDQQIIDLTNAKRDMQSGHQAVLKTFEKQEAKVFKRDSSTAERRPQNPESAPHISLLLQSPGSALDEHIGRERECFQRIALLSQRIPANIMRHGCQSEIVMLLVVKAMFDTGCSPGNYMSLAFFHANADVLRDYLIPCPAERVDLATSNSAQSITQHLVIEVRHVDTRGVTRTIKLRFGVLEGLRFNVVIGFYAIAINFMEVLPDLLTIQLEHQESQSHSLAMLYGTTPHLLMINSSPTSMVETDDSIHQYHKYNLSVVTGATPFNLCSDGHAYTVRNK
jgi:hypothetical protein